MSNPLLDFLGTVGNVLDTPGAAVRGLVTGNPMGITDPSQRTSGRQMLEQLFGMSPKEEGAGFDLGDLAGMGTEMLTDPINLIGGGLAAWKGMAGRAARASNATREAMLAKGAMPEEIAALTKAVDETGKPVRTYHGTPNVFEQYDMARANPDNLYGAGIYSTDNPKVASGYTSKGAISGSPENVRMQFLDSRNPLDLDKPVSKDFVNAALSGIGADVSAEDVGELLKKWGGGEHPTAGGLFNLIADAGENPESLFRSMGHDAFTHTGGTQAGLGGDLHRVWIAHDPNQVYAPYVAPGLKREPRISPLLAALGGENALARGAR